MSDELSTGLAATANQPTADTTASIDSVLDTAFETPSDAPAASEPSVQSEPATEPVAAKQPPQEQPQTDASKGEPPQERWPTILENARKKAAEDALEQHKQALQVVEALRADLPGTLAQMLEEAAVHPQHGDAIISRAAAILSARKKAGQEDARPEPDQHDDKYVWYSPEQQAKLDAWKERQIEKKLMEKLQPLQQLQQQFERHQQTKAEAEKAAAVAEKRGAAWKTMPHFNDNKDAILKRQQELYDQSKDLPGFDPTNGPWELMQQAFAEVVNTQVLPKLQTQQTEKMLASAAHKRAGSASDPAASLPATPRRPRTVDEALDQAFDGAGV